MMFMHTPRTGRLAGLMLVLAAVGLAGCGSSTTTTLPKLHNAGMAEATGVQTVLMPHVAGYSGPQIQYLHADGTVDAHSTYGYYIKCPSGTLPVSGGSVATAGTTGWFAIGESGPFRSKLTSFSSESPDSWATDATNYGSMPLAFIEYTTCIG